ncbi:Trp biosynthesis-associated membrane protein [Actinomycetospora sp.]|uniref:Trp biosynthesis-associated membrane protein n=1 Tax=Actinomycetospora sp. TaxID=1872135 RepID=UPI002F41DBE7
MTGPAGPAPRRPGSRLLGLAVVGLLLGALALWGASRGTWLTATWEVPLRGTVVATANGADTEPVLVPWALLALAAIGGLLATTGWGRRAVGVIVGVAGLWALLRAVSGLAAPAPALLPTSARQAGRALGVAVTPVWPLLAAVGGLLLVATGALVAARGSIMPRLGARYDAPTGPARTRPVDDERSLWEALDAGEDPTTGTPPHDPPVPGHRGDDESPAGPSAGRAPDGAEGGRG